MPIVLIITFFATALLYASVGFGGGSTYNALLVLTGVNYAILPAIALTCNIVVVSGGVVRFWRDGHLRVRPALPFLMASVPAAWVGGRLAISETLFVGLLGFALLLAGIRLALHSKQTDVLPTDNRPKFLPYLVGGAIGFLSGMVGIGGGIFLAPVLYMMKWDTPRRIAATCSLFILVNSFSGLMGQLTKLSDSALLLSVFDYWPLVISVFLGGQIGSWAASQRLQPDLIRRATAILILYVAVRLIYRWTELYGWL